MIKRKDIGNYGEQLALKAYLQGGYELLEQQFNCRFGEIDLILVKDGVLHFVEVRTKCGFSYGSAEESITEAKKRKIRLVSQYYLQQKKLQSSVFQIDVVAIYINKKEKKAWLKRYPAAF